MDRYALHRQMTEVLNELQRLNKKLEAQTDKIPALELDLFRMKLISLYDQLNQLAIANRSQLSAKPAENRMRNEKPEDEPEVAEPETENPPVEMPAPVEELINPVFIPELPYEEETHEEGEEQEEEQPEPEEEETFSNKKQEKATINSDPAVSLHEKLSKATQPPDLASSLKSQPLSDIRDGMSTSQRFQYIANLFGDDFELFSHSINYINSAANKKEVDDYLRINIEKKYKWNEEDPLVVDFKNLISRRFM